MSYTPRRLRKRPQPEWIIRVPWALDREQAERVRHAWLAAGRQGVAVIDDRITIELLR